MISKEKIFGYMEKFHSPVEQSTNGWFTAVCPFCGKEKLAFQPDYRIVKCWKGCIRGFITDLIQKYHGISYFEANEFLDASESGIAIPWKSPVQSKSKLLLPTGFVPILFGDTVLGKRARKYLSGRGFDLNYLDRLGVGYCMEHTEDKTEDFFGYIIIPFRCRSKLVYYIGRDFLGNQLRYKNPSREKFNIGKSEMFFNEEALYLQSKVYITEGWACAATIGPKGLSMQGSIMSTIQRNTVMLSDAEEIVFIPDAGYYSHGLEMAVPLVKEKKIKVLNLNKLFNRGLGKDVNEIGADKIYELENESPYLDAKILFHEKMKFGNRQLHK